MIAVVLVIGVVFVFLQSPRSTLIPAVVLPLSILGTFGPMYLLGYSIDNLSLMALDHRHRLRGRRCGGGAREHRAASRGRPGSRRSGAARQRRGELHGRFHEPVADRGVHTHPADARHRRAAVPRVRGDAVDRHPDFAGDLADRHADHVRLCAAHRNGLHSKARWAVWAERSSSASRTPTRVRSPRCSTMRCWSGWADRLDRAQCLFGQIGARRRSFPEQDNGLLMGQIIADQSISFQAMKTKLHAAAGNRAAGSRGGLGDRLHRHRSLNTANVYVASSRWRSGISRRIRWSQRLRPKLNKVSGARLFLQAAQDLRIGGRQSAAEYQYTLTSEDTAALYTWTPKLVTELGKAPRRVVTDVNSDLQQNGLQTYVTISARPRSATASRRIRSTMCSTTPSASAPSSTIFNPFNQYFVVMEVAPKYWQNPQMLERIRFSTAAGNASGSAQTQAPGGTVSGVTPYSAESSASASATTPTRSMPAPRPTPSPTAFPTAEGGSSTGSADSTAAETWCRCRAGVLCQQPHGDSGQSPERPGRRDDFLQPAARAVR
jgi:multidrug efflux pump